MRSLLAAALALLAALPAPAAEAQTVEEFYKGKQLKLMIGAAPGGGNDIFARLFAKHYGRLVPGNPTIVSSNLAAAAGIALANQLFATQPRDGSVIAYFQRNIPLEPLLGGKEVQYDSTKLRWLGSLNRETNVIVAWHTAPVKKVDDLFTTEMIVGSSGGGADTLIFPHLFNRMLKTRFKVVSGYSGGDEMDLAMERGETHGRASMTWTTLSTSRVRWLNEKLAAPIAQYGLKRDPALPDLPNMLDFVKDPDDRQVLELLLARQETGRPFATPPEVPADRLAALRQAFAAVARDPEFLADANQRGISPELMTGEDVEALLARMYKTPPETLQKARQALVISK